MSIRRSCERARLRFLEHPPACQRAYGDRISDRIDWSKRKCQLAGGRTLADSVWRAAIFPTRAPFAVQLEQHGIAERRWNRETIGRTLLLLNTVRPRIRIDTFSDTPDTLPIPSFDSLFARADRALTCRSLRTRSIRLPLPRASADRRGAERNLGFLQSLLRHPDFVAIASTLTSIEDHIARADRARKSRFSIAPFFESRARAASERSRLAWGENRNRDPLAVLHHEKHHRCCRARVQRTGGGCRDRAKT